jgi:hypothetical protein
MDRRRGRKKSEERDHKCDFHEGKGTLGIPTALHSTNYSTGYATDEKQPRGRRGHARYDSTREARHISKALSLNLDSKIFGSFAEIGAFHRARR